jgi:hypothetical protein
MPKPTKNLAEEWQRLLTEWEAAMAAYRTAVAAGGGSADAPKVEAAEHRLAAIKEKMDGVVAAGKAERQSRGRKEDLVVRVLDLGGSPDRPASSDETGNDPSSDR